MHKITITQADKKILSEHAENEKPNEACAILFGTGCTVSEIFLTENVAESPANFTISNDDLIKGYRIAEEKKLDVIGIFHSHPSSEAIPSATDKKFMSINPVVWIIYSGLTKNFRAYVSLKSEIEEIQIEEI